VRVFSLPPAQLAALLPQAENRFFAAPLLARPDLYAGFARLHAWLEQPAIDPLQAEEEALRLLATLFSLPGQPHSLSTPQLQQLRDYLMAQLDARHTLEDLATQLGLSRFAFLRQFKQRTGITPYAWLKRLRLEQGKKLLACGLPVSEVALAVGFFDQSHFHHGFRLAYGLTPAQFRQQMAGSRP
jgi:AraC-like DNA-binding protein